VSVILVGGGGAQLSEHAVVRDLYVSPLFARRRARAEASGVPWFVVSGRWGLLDPGDVLAPYPFSLAEPSASHQRAWGRFVAEQLCWSALSAAATSSTPPAHRPDRVPRRLSTATSHENADPTTRTLMGTHHHAIHPRRMPHRALRDGDRFHAVV
jgi:hypothetical protein